MTWNRWLLRPAPQETSFETEQAWRRERRAARATSLLTTAVLPAFRDVGEHVRRLGRDAEIIHAPGATSATFRVLHGGAVELDYTILIAADDTPAVRVRRSLVHLGRHASDVSVPPLMRPGEHPDDLSAERVREHLAQMVEARIRSREAELLADRPLIPLALTATASH